MSPRRITVVSCDAKDCTTKPLVFHFGPDFDLTRQRATERGWTHFGRIDCCPRHTTWGNR